jgi:hypothetical protein
MLKISQQCHDERLFLSFVIVKDKWMEWMDAPSRVKQLDTVFVTI